MTEFKVDTVVDLAGTGKPNFSTGVTMNGAALSTLNLGEYTASSSEPSSPKNGSIWWDTTNSKIFVYIDGEFKETVIIPAKANLGERAFFATDNGYIDYFSITTIANAQDFGDLTSVRFQNGASSNGSRITWAGGYNYGTSSAENTIDYVEAATAANAQDFGDLALARRGGHHSVVGDGTYGFFTGGRNSSNTTINNIDYWTMATTGNASDFGDMVIASMDRAAACDKTYAVVAGGYDSSSSDDIDYFTTATTGNASDFGNLSEGTQGKGVVFDATRAVYACGYTDAATSNGLEYVTMQTTGNATDFGDLIVSAFPCGASDGTTGVFTQGAMQKNIYKITIQTTGNATDTGYDCINNRNIACGGASGAAS